ncbi:MAG: hypothetical protein RDU30_18175 [Desulfovibrionaceae bacterium]|nr:hypothetical protein [Desulfovibrionaceae bacterium]
MNLFVTSFFWATAAIVAVLAVAVLASGLRQGRHLPEDFDFDRHKRFESR